MIAWTAPDAPQHPAPLVLTRETIDKWQAEARRRFHRQQVAITWAAVVLLVVEFVLVWSWLNRT